MFLDQHYPVKRIIHYYYMQVLKLLLLQRRRYTAQIAVLAILASVTGNKGDLDLVHELGIVANAMEVLCDSKEEFEKMAS